MVSCASSNRMKISGDKISGKTIGMNMSNSIKFHLEPRTLKNHEAIENEIPNRILSEMAKSFNNLSKGDSAIITERGSISIIRKNDSVNIENVQKADYLVYLTDLTISRVIIIVGSASPPIFGFGLVGLAATTFIAAASQADQSDQQAYMQELEVKGKYYLVDIAQNKVVKKGKLFEKDKRGYASQDAEIPWNLIGPQIVAAVFKDTPFISNP